MLAQRMHMVGIRQRPAQVCQERAGPTPFHPEPGRETVQRRGYWGDDSLGDEVDAPVLECRGVEQWQLVGLITRRSMVRIHPPLPEPRGRFSQEASSLR